MLFNSIDFVIFFPLVLTLFFVLPHNRRWILLLSASYFFYGYWKVSYLILIMITTLTSFYIAKLISICAVRKQKKWLLSLCLVINLGILFVFKYYDFFSVSLKDLLSDFGMTSQIPYLNVLLPVGISFYTFQTLSYVVDAYRGDIEPETHLGYFALYVSFFPQLVAGPIERPGRLLPQFHRRIKFNPEQMVNGFILIAWGFFLKLVIADQVGGYVDEIYDAPRQFTGGHYFLATFLFAYQIFCDFAGYSSIAIGVAKCFGYQLMINFNRPYFAQTVRDFWTRWHISLSTWFRDYLYIPLGGNRVSKGRLYLNLYIVFFLCGLWHGASWTFIWWGLCHGLYLVTSRAIWTPLKSRIPGRMPLLPRSVLNIAVTFTLVCFAWIFFRAGSMADAIFIINHLFDGWHFNINYIGQVILPFTFDNGAIAFFLTSMLFILIVEGVHLVQETAFSPILHLWDRSGWFKAVCLGSLVITILLFGKFSNQSFIYFQF